jgi:hypothetical protein
MASTIVENIFGILQKHPKEGLACLHEFSRVRSELRMLMDALQLMSLRSAEDDSDIYFQMMLMVAAFELQHEHFLYM